MSTNGTIDRRAKETRNRIGEAFLRLGGIRSISDIRVGELVREAGVARSTFYAHYQGLDDYMARSFADMLGRFAEADGADSGCLAILPVRSIIGHVAAAGGAADTLCDYRHFPAMMAAGERRLKRVAEERLERLRPDLALLDRRTLATVLAAGFLSLLRDWLEQGRRLAVDELARRYASIESLLAALPVRG